MLIQRPSHVLRSEGDLTAGWDLILPTGWAMDFWKSIIFAGARPAGKNRILDSVKKYNINDNKRLI